MTEKTLIHRYVDEARRGELSRVIARLESGFAVLGDPQVLRGYALLYPDPVVPHLNALAGEARSRFLADMARLGDAVLEVTGAIRINYEILGNVEPALHAHVVPRHADEPSELRGRPFFAYDWKQALAFDPKAHESLRVAIATALAGSARRA